MKKDYTLYYWASDLRNNTGEGILAKRFLFDIKKYRQNSILINTNKNQSNYKTFYHKYFNNFFGAVKLWKYYLKGYKTVFINYLPIWNFLIFLILPPKTILGPITGTLLYNKYSVFDTFRRAILLNILKSISLIIIFFRYKKILFSTELLKTCVKKNNLKKCYFNYVLQLFEGFQRSKTKDIDFLIYHRIHNNKNNNIIKDFIINSREQKFKIIVIGDSINFKGVRNMGYVSRNKIKELLVKTKYTFGSSENLYTLFVLDAITRNVTVFFDKNLKKFNTKIKYSKLIPIDFYDALKTTKYIINKIYNFKKSKKKNFFNKNNYEQYFKQNIYLPR